ncbi:MAG: hypothetical protein KatS3mg038_3434 [Candidatus Kapaibacterium sp.]|nr:MAG: hypothetical protein KatS3mg038_3434 [Candidatus Kapabacteria bacterium]
MFDSIGNCFHRCDDKVESPLGVELLDLGNATEERFDMGNQGAIARMAKVISAHQTLCLQVTAGRRIR